eukprot:TRINITY_DN5278_c0_g1_i1.p1 TRINITY_DN5278_c0_g1~~TRINITY_DN5278_c0_g1_i1.p1  ORF type:complete len:451 (+),score=177.15 TRINITY_DN5278_c0_g1_i1:121-1353(+)
MAGAAVVEGLPFGEEKKQYILSTLDPILEEMVSDLLTDMPRVPIEFMVQWMRRRSGTAQAPLVSISQKNEKLKQELKHLSGAVEEASAMIKSGAAPDEEEEDEEDDDCGDELPAHMIKAEASQSRARQSVSAEAYGEWNAKKAFTAPVHPKTDAQKDRIKSTLMKSFMFAELEPVDMDVVILATKEQTFKAGEQAIAEGDDGDFLFVIETGTLECIKKIDGENKVVKTCAPGDVFGELALLYNCPRAASVVAKDDSVCWQLDRETFNHIVKEAAVKKRNKYDAFLKDVALISGLGAYERSQIADALKPETYKKGDVVVKQDDPGDKFYILEEGALYALKDMGTPAEKRVMDYKNLGDYFGELALLKNQPRAASVVVASENAKVLTMSRASFSKMLGPLQHILAKQVASYE